MHGKPCPVGWDSSLYLFVLVFVSVSHIDLAFSVLYLSSVDIIILVSLSIIRNTKID